MWTEFVPGSFSHKEQCTSRFGNITEVFRVLGNLDPESLYLTKKLHLNSAKQYFKKHNRKTNPERHWMFRAERVPMNLSWKSTVLFILNHLQCKAAHVSWTGFSPKAPELHSAIMRIEPDLGSYYFTEQCTAWFTDNFGITKRLIYYHTTQSDQESSFEHRKAQTSQNTSERQTHYCTEC